MNISKIEGIGSAYADKLNQAGIKSTEGLLKIAASRKGRQELANQTGISMKLILGWANRADLMRIKGVGEEYSDLLEAAGVDTVKELGTRNPVNLHKAVTELNESKRLVRRVPSLSEIQRWIEFAASLAPVLTH